MAKEQYSIVVLGRNNGDYSELSALVHKYIIRNSGKAVSVDGEQCFVDISDDMEDYLPLTTTIRSADCFVIFYSHSSLRSYNSIPKIMKRVQCSKGVEKLPIVLIAHDSLLTDPHLREFVEDFGCHLIQTTNRGDHVDVTEDIFKRVIREARHLNELYKERRKKKVDEQRPLKGATIKKSESNPQSTVQRSEDKEEQFSIFIIGRKRNPNLAAQIQRYMISNSGRTVSIDNKDCYVDISDDTEESVPWTTMVKGADGFIIFYSDCPPDSRDSLKNSITRILDVKHENRLPMVLIAKDSKIYGDEIKEIVDKFKCTVIFDDGDDPSRKVNEMFEQVIRDIRKQSVIPKRPTSPPKRKPEDEKPLPSLPKAPYVPTKSMPPDVYTLSNTYKEDIYSLLNNPAHSDIKFKFPKENNKILYGHKVLIYFNGTGTSKEFLNGSELAITDTSSTVFLTGLQQAYSANRNKENKINLAEAVNNELFHDIKFVCEGREIYAHTNILYSRSSYFKALLSSDMIETRERVIQISNVGYKAFLSFLRYLYTGQFAVPVRESSSSINMILELFCLAELYNCSYLKCCCEAYLIDSISIDTVVGLYEYAEVYSPILQQWCIHFILTKGFEEVIKQKQFRKNPELIEIISRFNPGPFGMVINHGWLYIYVGDDKRSTKPYFFVLKDTPSGHHLLFLKNETSTAIKGYIDLEKMTEPPRYVFGHPHDQLTITTPKFKYTLLSTDNQELHQWERVLSNLPLSRNLHGSL